MKNNTNKTVIFAALLSLVAGFGQSIKASAYNESPDESLQRLNKQGKYLADKIKKLENKIKAFKEDESIIGKKRNRDDKLKNHFKTPTKKRKLSPNTPESPKTPPRRLAFLPSNLTPQKKYLNRFFLYQNEKNHSVWGIPESWVDFKPNPFVKK